VRSDLRGHNICPLQVSAENALDVLDDLGRSIPGLIASQWYAKATENQIRLFKREWNRWRQENGKSLKALRSEALAKKLRKMAWCGTCEKRRKISVRLISFKTFYPGSGDMVYLDDIADCEIVCRTCGAEIDSTWTLSSGGKALTERGGL
jgi:hypothetical protein